MNKHGGYHGTDLIDFSVNLNPMPKPEAVQDLFQESFDKILHYPEIDQHSFREFLAERLGFSSAELMVGNGATELMYLLAQALDVETVGIFDPTYSEYRRAFENANKRVISIPRNPDDGFHPDWNQLPVCDLYILCNPNNPTGNYVRDIQPLMDTGAWILLDESFLDFVADPVDMTGAKVIRMRSLTKFYGIAGLRVGYMIADHTLIQKLRQFQPPWSVNAIALALIEPLMESEAYQRQTHVWLAQERARFRQELPGLIGGEANFFLLKTTPDRFDQLQQRGFYLRQCDDFIGLGPEYLRFCIHEPERNQQLIAALKEIECCT